MIEMSILVFVLMVVLIVALVAIAFVAGIAMGAWYQTSENEKNSNSTEVAKFEN